MWYLWVIFAVFAALIPVGIMSMAVRAAKPYRNDKRKIKVISCNVIKYCLFYCLCDLFFMSFIIDSLACKFIFGGLIMLIIFYNLSNVFVAGKKNSFSHFAKWVMMQDFVVGISLSTYLIYIVPNADLQNIIIPIVAGVYGGLLTLVGVAWTINHEKEERFNQDQNRNRERKLEEQKKYKPIFNLYHGEFPKSFINAEFENFNGIQEIGCGYQGEINREKEVVIESFVVENSSFVEFYIRGIKINEQLYERKRNLFVKKETYILFDLDRQPLYLTDIFQTISLVVEDLLGNIYDVWLGTEITLEDEIKHIEVKGSRRIKIEEPTNE